MKKNMKLAWMKKATEEGKKLDHSETPIYREHLERVNRALSMSQCALNIFDCVRMKLYLTALHRSAGLFYRTFSPVNTLWAGQRTRPTFV